MMDINMKILAAEWEQNGTSVYRTWPDWLRKVPGVVRAGGLDAVIAGICQGTDGADAVPTLARLVSQLSAVLATKAGGE